MSTNVITMKRKPRLGPQLVYVQCRSLFVGQSASIRDLDAIKKILQEHRKAIPVLFNGYPFEKVCLIAQTLLFDGVFTSEARARKKFSLLFKSAQHVPSEKAMPEKDTSKEALSKEVLSKQASSVIERSQINTGRYLPMVAGAQNKLESPGSEAKSSEEAMTSGSGRQHTAHSSEARAHIPSTPPLYLPYGTQHRILNNVQAVLEGCCFDFAKEFLPELIKARELEVPEQLELAKWVSLLKQSASQLPVNIPLMIWNNFLDVAEKVQSTIARRIRTSVTDMVRLLDEVVVMTRTLNDGQRTAWCQDICGNLRSSLAQVEGLGKDLREMLSVELEDIASKRAELDSMEIKAIAHMVELEKQNRHYVCEAIEKALVDPDAARGEGLLISDGSELETPKEEGRSHYLRNMVDGQLPDAPADDLSSKKRTVSTSAELGLIQQTPRKLNQADPPDASSREPKLRPSSTPIQPSNFLSFHPTTPPPPPPPRMHIEPSSPHLATFSEQLAAEMTFLSLTEPEQPSAPLPAPASLHQAADLNPQTSGSGNGTGTVKSKAQQKQQQEAEEVVVVAKPPPYAARRFGSVESRSEKSGVWGYTG